MKINPTDESISIFRVLFEMSPDAFIIYDPMTGIFLNCNPATLSLFLCSSEEQFLSFKPWELSPVFQTDGQRSIDKAGLLISEVMNTGHKDFQWLHKRQDGTEFYAQVLLFSINIQGKELLVANVRDLTQQKSLIDNLMRSEEKFRKLVEVLVEGIFITDAVGVVTYANKELLKIHGFKQQEQLIGRKFTDFILQPIPKELNDYLKNISEGLTPSLTTVLNLSRPDNIECVIEINAKAIRNHDNKVITEGSVRDITELTKNRQFIIEIQQKQELILNSISEGLHGIDLDEKIIFVNQAAINMLGWSREELIGQRAHSFIHHTKSDGTIYPVNDCPIYATLHDGISRYDNNEIFWRKDGTSFPVEYNSTPLKNSKGQIVGTIVSFRDITDRLFKKNQLTCSEENLNLAYKEIHNKNLQLKESNQIRAEFLAAISHELKTPLNAIIGFSELLRDGLVGTLSTQQHEYIQDICGAGEKLLHLITGILEYTRLEAGYTKLELSAVNALACLAESLIPWREKAKEKGLSFSLNIEKNLGLVWVDAIKLRQIVVALLSNAVKFTPRGGTIVISQSRVPAEQIKLLQLDAFPEYLEIKICDSGEGFSTEKLKFLFEPFHQGDASLARKYEGIGLGLVLVDRLVALHGGKIHIDNVAPKGACVTFWLPWRDSDSYGDANLNLKTMSLNGIQAKHEKYD